MWFNWLIALTKTQCPAKTHQTSHWQCAWLAVSSKSKVASLWSHPIHSHAMPVACTINEGWAAADVNGTARGRVGQWCHLNVNCFGGIEQARGRKSKPASLFAGADRKVSDASDE